MTPVNRVSHFESSDEENAIFDRASRFIAIKSVKLSQISSSEVPDAHGELEVPVLEEDADLPQRSGNTFSDHIDFDFLSKTLVYTKAPWYARAIINFGKNTSLWNFVIKHDTPARMHWDFLVLFFLVVVAFANPYYMAFVYYDSESCIKSRCESDLIIAAEACSDLVFAVDIWLNFHTSIFDETGKHIVDLNKIARAYLTGWFVPDILSTIPFESAGYLLRVEHADTLRLLRLLKIGRLFRFMKIKQRMQPLLEVAGVADRINILGMFMLLCGLSHWATCAFWIVVNIDDPDTAFNGYFKENDIVGHDDISNKYITSLYWSIVTLTTIGFGDITPSSETERGFCCLVCSLSVTAFAFVVAKSSTLLAESDAASAHFRRESNAMSRYMLACNLPLEMRKRIQQFHHYCYYNNKQNVRVEDMPNVLSKGMRAEIALHLHLTSLQNVKIFQGSPIDFFERLCLHLKTEFTAPNEVIFREGDFGDSMYLLVKGVVSVRHNGGLQLLLQKGQVFGDIAVMGLENSRRSATVASISYCHLARILKPDLHKCLSYYPEIRSRVRVSALWGLVRKAFLLSRHLVRMKMLDGTYKSPRRNSQGVRQSDATHASSTRTSTMCTPDSSRHQANSKAQLSCTSFIQSAFIEQRVKEIAEKELGLQENGFGDGSHSFHDTIFKAGNEKPDNYTSLKAELIVQSESIRSLEASMRELMKGMREINDQIADLKR